MTALLFIIQRITLLFVASPQGCQRWLAAEEVCIYPADSRLAATLHLPRCRQHITFVPPKVIKSSLRAASPSAELRISASCLEKKQQFPSVHLGARLRGFWAPSICAEGFIVDERINYMEVVEGQPEQGRSVCSLVNLMKHEGKANTGVSLGVKRVLDKQYPLPAVRGRTTVPQA